MTDEADQGGAQQAVASLLAAIRKYIASYRSSSSPPTLATDERVALALTSLLDLLATAPTTDALDRADSVMRKFAQTGDEQIPFQVKYHGRPNYERFIVELESDFDEVVARFVEAEDLHAARSELAELTRARAETLARLETAVTTADVDAVPALQAEAIITLPRRISEATIRLYEADLAMRERAAVGPQERLAGAADAMVAADQELVDAEARLEQAKVGQLAALQAHSFAVKLAKGPADRVAETRQRLASYRAEVAAAEQARVRRLAGLGV